jgi:hypothetical protein
VKPLSNEENMLLESGRSTTLLVASHLDKKKEQVASRICIDRISTETFNVVEQLAARLFEEMALKRVKSSILLVGTEGRTLQSISRPSSRDSRPEPKRAITHFLRRIVKQKPSPQVNLSNLSTCPQESQNNTFHRFIDLEQS